MITNKGLLYSTGNYTQYLVVTSDGKESKKEHIYTCLYSVMRVTESLCFCMPETNPTLEINSISIQNYSLKEEVPLNAKVLGSGEMIIQREESQKDKYHVISLTCGI